MAGFLAAEPKHGRFVDDQTAQVHPVCSDLEKFNRLRSCDPIDSAGAPKVFDEVARQSCTASFEGGLETPRGAGQQQQQQGLEVVSWVGRMVHRKVRMSMCLRVRRRWRLGGL